MQAHFKGEWGTHFEERKIGVEKMIGDEWDMENPVHKAAAFDKTILGMVAELQQLRAERRTEPGLPGTGDTGDGASGAIEKFEEFSSQHPDYVNDPDPKIRSKGAALRDLAWAAKKRSGG
ncbi:unnamed protein product [marine sediment metagenome]|uniref:Uncharacterized protein n=1 Tax=marine sediment metagenome TaxID=412755 RepID=X1TEI1_9ZZZZ